MELPNARKRATIDDVVELSGVSRSSVFRYLSGKRLKPELQEAVDMALRRTGYALGKEAEASSQEILLSSPSSTGGFRGYADIVEGVMTRAAEKGIRVRLGGRLGERSGRAPAGSGAELLAAADGVSGAILLGTTIIEEEADVRALQERGIPFVLVNRIFEGGGISFVSPDFEAAADEVVGHLIAIGRRRIALWDDGSEHFRMQRDKLSGYLLAHAEARLEAPSELLFHRDAESIESVAGRALASASPPDAWFAMDDQAAMRVIRVARGRGLRVPEDLAVAGMNDIETASFAHPSITSVSLPFYEAGRTAVDMMSRLTNRPVESSIRILLAHRLIIRESTVGAPRRGGEQ
jgi:DNA-binding LacI/PurR family transcriptional regulator